MIIRYNTKCIYYFALLICFSIITPSNADCRSIKILENYVTENNSDRYIYSYEDIIEDNSVIGTENRLKIISADNIVLYEDVSPLMPGRCDNFPAIKKYSLLPLSKVTSDNNIANLVFMVVTCGSQGGRNQTIRIFYNDHSFIKVTHLNFGDTSPNLEKSDGDGYYKSKVYRRILFEDIYPSPLFIIIYKLQVNESIFGFTPVFKDKSYMDYYNFLLGELEKHRNTNEYEYEIEDYIGPMLSALLAMENKKVICGGIKYFISNGVTLEKLILWELRLRKIGYPGFSIKLCGDK